METETETEGNETSPKEGPMLGTRIKGLTKDEDKDLPRCPAWKMTGPLPTEGRIDGEVNTSVCFCFCLQEGIK